MKAETIRERVEYLVPGLLASGAIPKWPPDVFCISAAVLQRSGAYASVVEDRPPHLRGIRSKVRTANLRNIGRRWRDGALGPGPLPIELDKWWRTVLKHADRPLSKVEQVAECCAAFLNLLAAADEACKGVGIANSSAHAASERGIQHDRFLEEAEFHLLKSIADGSTLCSQIHPSKARVLPKMHTPQNGLTIRSLSHNLAYSSGSEVRPIWLSCGTDTQHHALNLLVIPWPQSLRPSQFRQSKKVSLTDEVLRGGYGLFTFSAERGPSNEFIRSLLRKAIRQVGQIDGVVLPELAVSMREYERLAKVIVNDQRFLIAGVGCEAVHQKKCGENAVLMDVMLPKSTLQVRLSQRKHHRWKLEKSQIMQYGIGSNLHPEASWWEHISLRNRSLEFVTLRPWLTLTILLCEDLARPDPVADLVRAVGPNLVIALLMDGPQLTSRWPGRYAGSLSDDPGCSVLSLTSSGMSSLSQPLGGGPDRSNVVALWRDAKTGPRELSLPQGAGAMVLNLTVEYDEEWTADGRGDGGVSGYPILAGYHPIF